MATPFLSRFTPSLMDAKTLEAVFVQRERLAQRIVDTIRDNTRSGARSHTLLIGPRGIGKTHLLSLIYYRLTAVPELHGSLRIAWLREEEWGVSSFLDLQIRILRALAETDASLTPQIEALYSQTPAQATRAARTILEETLCGQPLLLMAENLNDLFAGLGTNGQQAFRSFLQETGLVTILATAQGLFADVSRQSAPFYGFFRVEHLPGLNLDEAVALLTKIAALEEASISDEAGSLTAYLKTPTGRARVRAVHHLAGGNPRVYVIFCEFLTRDSLDELVSPFLKMLDELTPYYQARMQGLSAQQRKIVEILVEVRGAISVKDIAQRGFMSQQTASSQLKELRTKGYVQSHSIGRESFYELQEPLMRLCLEVKKQRGEPIKLFVAFLRLWCSPSELERRLEILPADADFTKRCLQEALSLADSSEDPIIAAVMHDLVMAVKAALEKDEYGKLLEVSEEMSEIAPHFSWGWHLRGFALALLGHYETALSFLERATKLEPDNHSFWLTLGHLHLRLNNNDEAATAYCRAVEIAPDNLVALAGYGRVLIRLARYEDALTIFEKASFQESQGHEIRYGRMTALSALGRWSEVLVLELAQHSEATQVLPSYAYTVKFFLLSSPAIWQEQIKLFSAIYIQHNAVSTLGSGLVQAISRLSLDLINPVARRLWLTTWQEALAGQPEAELPLRMLETAIRYWESGDPPDARILLELPAEQREILQPLLIQTE